MGGGGGGIGEKVDKYRSDMKRACPTRWPSLPSLPPPLLTNGIVLKLIVVSDMLFLNIFYRGKDLSNDKYIEIRYADVIDDKSTLY